MRDISCLKAKSVKFACGVLIAIMISSICIFGLCACNNTGDSLTLRTGSRPNNPTVIVDGDVAKINAAMSESATEEQKKNAVMVLYNVANQSRMNTPLSLMLQSSNAGISLGDVIMHGFNLKSGDKWYYQLATQASSGSEFLNTIMKEIAELLKIAYTNGNGEYYYTVIKGSEPNCDCTIETFPYATFSVTKEPRLFAEADFKDELHYLNGMHEINNMYFCAEIIADGAKITHNDAGYYTAEFSVDMNADPDLLERWFALPKEDMAVGGQTLERYTYYNAVLEVWDNGYAKSFKSYSDRKAGMGSGSPIDEFEYLWNENEILALLKEDKSIEMHSLLDGVEDYIDYYSDPQLVAAKFSSVKIAGIAIGSVIVLLILTLIALRIATEVLLKKGKLKRVAAKREAKRQKKLAKEYKKKGIDIDFDEMFADDIVSLPDVGEICEEVVNEAEDDYNVIM